MTYFQGCIPNYVVQEAKDYALLKVFSDNNDEMPAKFTDKEAILSDFSFLVLSFPEISGFWLILAFYIIFFESVI